MHNKVLTTQTKLNNLRFSTQVHKSFRIVYL